jgi:hypothetical protein
VASQTQQIGEAFGRVDVVIDDEHPKSGGLIHGLTVLPLLWAIITG